MNNIKSRVNEALVISGGINEEGIGLQVVSKGKQLYASESSYLFFSDSEVKNAFHFKTRGGFLIDGNDKNQFHINNIGLKIDCLNSRSKILGDYIINIGGKSLCTYDGGKIEEVSGGNYELNLKENGCDFLLNLRNGDINFNNFSNFSLIGDKVKQTVNKVELDVKEIEYKIKESLKIKVGDYGVDIGENIGIMSGGKLKMIGLNGDVELVSRNGERLKIENERPNGEVHIKSSSINGKIFIVGNNCKLNVKKLFIDCENFNLTTDIFNLKTNIIKYDVKNFLLNAGNITVNTGEFRIGDKIYIGEKIRLNVDMEVDCENFGVKCINGRLEIDEIDIRSDKFFLGNRNERLIVSSGIKYDCENTTLKVNMDEIGLISGGNLGVLISGEKGGIRMLGDLMWNNGGYQLLSTDITRKLIKLGNDRWVVMVDNLDINGYLKVDGIFEGNYGLMKEVKDVDGFRWIFGEGLLMLSPEKIVIKRGGGELKLSERVELLGEIIMDGSVRIIGDVEVNGGLRVECLEVKGKVLLGEDGNRLEFGDGIKLGRYMEMGSNVKLDCENDFMLNVGGDYRLDIGVMDLKMDRKFENIGDYYGIIKGEYNLQFVDGFIRVKDGVEIMGERVKIGLIKMEDKNLLIEGDKLELNFDEIDFGRIFIGDRIRIGEEKNGLFITGEGVHLMSKYGLDMVSLDKVELMGKCGINMEGRDGSIRMDGGIEMRGDGNMVGKRHYLGWDYVNLEDEKRVVVLGGEGGQIFLRDGLSSLNGRVWKMIGDEVGLDGGIMSINYGSCRMMGDNLWIRGKGSEVLMGENMEISAKMVRVKVEEDSLIEFGRELRVNVGDTNINLNGGGYRLFGRDVKVGGERIELESRRDMIMSAINGDVSIGTKTGNIMMDGISKKIRIESDSLIEIDCRRLNIRGDMRYIGENMELEMGGIEIRVEGDMDSKCMGNWDGYFGNSVNIEFGKLELKSEKYGELKIMEEGVRIETTKDFEILGDNMMGELRVYHRGFGKIELERGLDLGSRGRVNILGEEELIMGSGGDVRIVGKGELRIQGSRWKGRYDKIDWEMGKIDMRGDELDYFYREMRIRQEGCGVMEISVEDSIRLVDKFEGHKEGKMEILSESNTHEGSIVIRSRVGGIILDGQSININGQLKLGKVKMLSMEETLRLDGLLELEGMRIGRNMFIGVGGISLMKREEIEMRNMDINLDGEMRLNGMRVGRIDGGKLLDIVGKVRVNNGFEVRGDVGMEMEGINMGKWEGGGRVALSIDLVDNIWNEGIRIRGNGNAIDVDGEVKIGGRLDVSEIRVKNERRGKTRELEENEIEKMLEEMDVEMGEDGQLVGGNNDLLDMIKKMMAIIKHQSKIINNLR
jgi:hypothetical protein